MMRFFTVGWFALLLSAVVPQAIAALPPMPSLTGSPTNLALDPLATKDFGSAAVGTAVNGTLETLTVNVQGATGPSGVQFDASNPSGDFAVAGGTCTDPPASWSSIGTCTLQLRFAPIATGIRNGLLSISCRALTVAIGIAGLVCDGVLHDAYYLTGIGTAIAANPVPALGREGLTLMALMLIGASLLALRRKR
jgi:hypothetical protein